MHLQAPVTAAETRQGARARGSQAEQLGALVRLAASRLAEADHAADVAGLGEFEVDSPPLLPSNVGSDLEAILSGEDGRWRAH